MAEQKETPKAAEKSSTVLVEFPNGTNEKGETVYRVQEVGREIAEAELAKPETADKIKEGEPVKLRNSAWVGARLKK